MNLVDSSGWLAFFADEKNASKFAKPLEDTDSLLVPTIIMYEVFKVILREKGEQAAIVVQAHLQQGTIVELSPQLALSASRLSLEHRLPMADSIILSTARSFNACIWTQDEHFSGMTSVKYFPET
jgi:predicted nucleic acid-binding protein